MYLFSKLSLESKLILGSILALTITSLFTLRSLTEFSGFKSYLILVIVFLAVFYVLLHVDFEIFNTFSPFIYYFSVFLLILNFVIGSVTRGTVRWLNLGGVSFQPSEIIRPFLILYFANFLASSNSDKAKFIKVIPLFLIPFTLILIQPSLGVALLTAVGFFGVLIASDFDKRKLFSLIAAGIILVPSVFFLLKPYQKERIVSFLDPWQNPQGSGYNSIQSMISVGSGGILGKGLGEGSGTQLRFLPERQTDFIFAAISEEMGFVGALIILISLFVLLVSLSNFLKSASNPAATGFISGVLLTFLAQTFINVGMNVGILPITGVPLPFVSQGGSSLLASLISIALCIRAKEGSIVLRGNSRYNT